MKLIELDESWSQWLRGRPQVIQDLAARFPPNLAYVLKTTGQIVTLQAYSEDGTLRVCVLPEYSGPVTGGCSVFGIEPDDLEPATEQQMAARLAEVSP